MAASRTGVVAAPASFSCVLGVLSVAVPAFGRFAYSEGKDSAVSELKLCSSTLLEQAAGEKQSSSSSFLRPSTEVCSHGGLTGLL
jgi:hypothetical protein